MKIIFAGTPEFAKIQLNALIKAGLNIIAVYTQPDRPVGRGLKLQPSPVKEAALKAHLAIEQPLNFKAQSDQAILKAYEADLMIVSAYGLILPKVILNTPLKGCWNVHASLLPRWRGAAPIQQAILAGDEKTGITLMQMNEGLDTGDILTYQEMDITPKDTSASLHEKLAYIGAELLISTLKQVSQGHALTPIPQNNALATLAPKIHKSQGKLNWHQTALELYRLIQAFNPWPSAYAVWEGISIKVWEAQVIKAPLANLTPGTIVQQSSLGIDVMTKEGILRLTHIQLPNKRRMAVSEVLNSKPAWFQAGQRFD